MQIARHLLTVTATLEPSSRPTSSNSDDSATRWHVPARCRPMLTYLGPAHRQVRRERPEHDGGTTCSSARRGDHPPEGQRRSDNGWRGNPREQRRGQQQTMRRPGRRAQRGGRLLPQLGQAVRGASRSVSPVVSTASADSMAATHQTTRYQRIGSPCSLRTPPRPSRASRRG